MAKQVAKVDAGLPAYLQGYEGATGNENIDNEDVTIPRIKLAQGTTPEVKAGDITEGAFFLNITGEVLAHPGEPLRVIPIAQSKEFILWRDQNFDGGGIFARAHRVDTNNGVKYEWDKQGQTFENKIKGLLPVTWKTVRFVSDNNMDKFGSSNVDDTESFPAATAHHNYVVALPDHGMMIAAISLSNTAVKKAKAFNAMLKLIPARVPIFSRVFNMSRVQETNGAGQVYNNYDFKPAGDADEADFFIAKDLFAGFESTGYTVDQTGGDESTADNGKF